MNDNLKIEEQFNGQLWMPLEYVSLFRELTILNRVIKPVLDISQIDDVERVICEALEFNDTVQFLVLKPLPFLNSDEISEITYIEEKIHYINQLINVYLSWIQKRTPTS